MQNAYSEFDCSFCGNQIQLVVNERAPAVCVGGITLSESYITGQNQEQLEKSVELVCKKCGARSRAAVALSEDRSVGEARAIDWRIENLQMARSQGGSLTIRHLGTRNPGIVNFNHLYPVPPQVDNQGNIPLPVGGIIRVFRAVVGDIYIFRRVDPPIEVCNESQTGYFAVSKKLSQDPGFTEHANIWGKAVVAQHPHLQRCVTYNIQDPGDRIHLTYNHFSVFLMEKNLLTVEELAEVPAEQQFERLIRALAEESG